MQFRVIGMRRATGWPAMFTLEAPDPLAARAAAREMGYEVEGVSPARRPLADEADLDYRCTWLEPAQPPAERSPSH